MDLDMYKLHDTILCIDLKSFFASVECVVRNRNPMHTPLLVADKSRGGGTIVLSVSPYLKSFGVPNRLRLWQVDAPIGYMIAQPRMALYIEYSRLVTNVYLKYVSIEDMFIYSIDEAFLDLSTYMSLYKKNAYEIAQMILADLQATLGLYASVGIGKNMVMAKMAMDLEAKKSADFIAEWNYDNFSDFLWPVTELADVWGIGWKTSKKLYNMGIYSMGDLAHYSVEKLQKHFGVLGDDLFLHANCIDISKVQDKYKLGERKGYSIGQTLFRDFINDELYTLFYELCQELARRLRNDNKSASVISMSLGYSKRDYGKGIHMQRKLSAPTNDGQVLYGLVHSMLIIEYRRNTPVHRVSVHVGKTANFTGNQISIFDTVQDNYKLNKTVDELKERFGKNAVLYGSSYTQAGTIRERNKLIGGHRS